MAEKTPSPAATSKHDERRRAGRVRCNLTVCQYGTVLNLSRTGMRVATRKPVGILPPGASTNIQITSAGQNITVPGRPIHNRPRPDGMFDVGFQFVGLTEKAAAELMHLARTAWDGTRLYNGRKAG